MGKSFTKEDEDFIRDNYFKLSYREIANKLGRTEMSISNKARRLKIERTNKVKDDTYRIDSLHGEVWEDVNGLDGRYKVSNMGRVRSVNRIDKATSRHRRGMILKHRIDKYGYERIMLRMDGWSKLCSVHRLVAEAFLPNPDNLPMVNHKDENPRNNHVDNLEWCDAKYNVNYGTGLERSGRARNKPVIMMDADYNVIMQFDSLKQIEKELGFDHSNIGNACRKYEGLSNGYRWKWKYNSLETNADGTSYFKGLSKKQWRDKYGRAEESVSSD